jgi:hypothetical protein
MPRRLLFVAQFDLHLHLGLPSLSSMIASKSWVRSASQGGALDQQTLERKIQQLHRPAAFALAQFGRASKVMRWKRRRSS